MQGLSWVAGRWVNLHTCQNLKFYIEDLTGFNDISGPDGLNSHITLWRLSPWNSPHCENSGPNVHSKNTEGMFSSVTQSCPTLCNLLDYSTPGFPVQHQLLEPTQTHVHRVSDAIQPSHPPLSPLFLPSIFPNIRVFSNELVLCIRWPKYWSFSFSISPPNQDWFPLGWTGWMSLQTKGTLESFLQHHSSKASILWHSGFLIVQLSHPYMTTGKTIALTRWTFVGKGISLCFNMLSSISWS